VAGEQENPRLRALLRDGSGELDSIEEGHPDIREDHVGRVGPGGGESRPAVLVVTDEEEPERLPVDAVPDALPHHRLVIDDDDREAFVRHRARRSSSSSFHVRSVEEMLSRSSGV
jgi:hypothetical protein